MSSTPDTCQRDVPCGTIDSYHPKLSTILIAWEDCQISHGKIDCMKYPEKEVQGLQPLTAKALKFCEMIAKGHRSADAYMTAYNTSEDTSKRSIQACASRLLGDPRVKRQVERVRQKQDVAMAQQALGLKEWTLQRLKEEASDSESPPAARVSALALLAKASKLIESGSQVSVNVANVSRPSAEIEQELLARLTAISQTPNTYDVTPADEGEDREKS